jgi:MFS transporter, DHA2 family, multidrug resistance protein
LNGAYPDYLQHLGSALGAAPDSATTMASVYQGIVTQATLLSYLDDFKVLGLIFLALLPLLFLVKPGEARSTGMAH